MYSIYIYTHIHTYLPTLPTYIHTSGFQISGFCRGFRASVQSGYMAEEAREFATSALEQRSIQDCRRALSPKP